MKRVIHFKGILALLFIFGATLFIQSQTTIDIPITNPGADAGDDAEQRISNGNVSLNSSDLELCTDGANDQYVGVRFQNVTIPAGATVTNAYIEFQADEANNNNVVIEIIGIDVDNAAQFNSNNSNISDRIDGTISSNTTANATWTFTNANAWSVGERGADTRTPSIISIVQEIVDRGGWSGGNSMAFVFSKSSGSGKRVAEDGDSNGQGAVLHVVYTTIPSNEIDITGNGNGIANGNTAISTTDDTDFGNTTTGVPISHTFTIQNTGSLPLNLTGGPLVAISGDTSFSVTSQPSASTIAASNSLTFIVQYNPTTTGLNTATISIDNDDSNENPYTFDVQGSNLNIASGGAWSYLDDGSDQGTAWYSTVFDYSSWATGNSMLGYGAITGGVLATTTSFIYTDAPTNSLKNITTYFRKSFTITAADVANSTLVMNAVRDDGMVVYIDGNQVWINNMPTIFDYTTNSSSTISGADESAWNTKKIVNPFSVPGTYEVGVEIHQRDGNSSDLSFDFEMYTNNDYVFVPPPAPDVDADNVADYIDSDDDNDGVPDIVEGCYTANFEGLNTVGGVSGPEEEISGTLNGTSLTMDDGNVINFSVTGTFNSITSYYAGEHGWAVRTKGNNTLGTLTFDFASDVTGLFFKLVDFDENETHTINAYDSTNTLIDLTTSNNVYHLGTYVTQTGNTFNDHFLGLASNNNGDVVASDAYGSVYFYFPTTAISKIDFIVDQPDGSTIRIAAMHFCGLDTDSDGVDDYYDSDSDNDGIPDLVEAGGTDIDGDGIIDVLTDTDIDGLADTYDSTPNVYFAEEVTTLADLDFDGDGFKNRIDLDSDNDGIVDLIEAGGTDIDGDAKLDSFVDSNSDGYHDSFDGASISHHVEGKHLTKALIQQTLP
ncbi:MAG: choice-of-anchor D domain-containing protein, partial [Urechidicola sp.]|nr:choice-of-anchor D domain-containing protein [Urechidicola sp.]